MSMVRIACAVLLVALAGGQAGGQSAPVPRSATQFIVASSSPLPGVTAGVPSVLALSDGRYRLYFCSGPDGLRSAVSDATGETLTLDAGSRMRGACDGSFIALRDGRHRFLTTENLGTTFGRSQVISFVTTDGLTFTRENGVRFAGSAADAGFTGVPQAVALPDGRYRLYYVGDPLNPSPGGNGIRTAISADEGLTWTPEVTVSLLPRSYVDPEVVPLSGGGYRMFVRVPGRPGGAQPGEAAGIYYADSSDGLSFSIVGRVIRDPEDVADAADPAVMLLSGGRVKMFIGSRGGEIRVATATVEAGPRRRSVRKP